MISILFKSQSACMLSCFSGVQPFAPCGLRPTRLFRRWHSPGKYTGVGCHVLCEMKIYPAISINKKCHSHQWFLASKWEQWLPKLRSRGSCHPSWWLLRSWGNARSSHLPLLNANKKTGFALHSWGAYEKNELSEARGLHLSIQRIGKSSLP